MRNSMSWQEPYKKRRLCLSALQAFLFSCLFRSAAFRVIAFCLCQNLLFFNIFFIIPIQTYNVAINCFYFACFSSKIITGTKAMLIIFNFNQSKNNSIYLYDIINLIWYKYGICLGKLVFAIWICTIIEVQVESISVQIPIVGLPKKGVLEQSETLLLTIVLSG